MGTAPAQAFPRKGRANPLEDYVPRISLHRSSRVASPPKHRTTRRWSHADSRLVGNRDTGSL